MLMDRFQRLRNLMPREEFGRNARVFAGNRIAREERFKRAERDVPEVHDGRCNDEQRSGHAQIMPDLRSFVTLRAADILSAYDVRLPRPADLRLCLLPW